MKIKITQKDIDYATEVLKGINGPKKNWKYGDQKSFIYNCPISQAIKRKNLGWPQIWADFIKINDITYFMTSKIEGFINKFDRGEKVKPTTLELLECVKNKY